MKKIALVALLLASATTLTFGQGLKSAPTVFTSGKWKVVRTTDPMTDKPDCTGIFENNYSTQLTESALYIGVRGGISSIKYRFDEEEPQGVRLPTDIEKRADTAILEGSDFGRALRSTRLRVQFLTLVRGVQVVDIDTTNMMDALENIKSGCPIGSPAPTEKQATTKSPAASCSSEQLARMRAAKITAAQIKAVCEN